MKQQFYKIRLPKSEYIFKNLTLWISIWTKHIDKRHILHTIKRNGNIKSSRFGLLLISPNYHTFLWISHTRPDEWSKQKRGQSEQQCLSTPSLAYCVTMAAASRAAAAVAMPTAGMSADYPHLNTHSNTLTRAHTLRGKTRTRWV